MNYDNPDGKYPPAKLTEPQAAFLRRLSSKGQDTVWPGTDTRVANGLQRAGLVSIVSDVATLTAAGRERLAAAQATDASGEGE